MKNLRLIRIESTTTHKYYGATGTWEFLTRLKASNEDNIQTIRPYIVSKPAPK